MPDSPLKLKPIKDLLDEILDTVEPIITYSIGDTTLEFWKPDHINEKYYLRLVSVQVEQMVVGRQYQSILKQLNELSEQTEIDGNLQGEINRLSQQFTQKGEELFPLSCQYLEALSELEPGQLIEVLKSEIAKRKPRKQLPLKLFINELADKVRKAMEPVEQQAALEAEPDEEEDADSAPLEVLPQAESNGYLPSANSEPQLVTTSVM